MASQHLQEGIREPSDGKKFRERLNGAGRLVPELCSSARKNIKNFGKMIKAWLKRKPKAASRPGEENSTGQGPVTNLQDQDGIKFTTLQRNDIQEETLQECVNMFCACYATWGPGAPAARVGHQVKTTVQRLRKEHLFSDDCCLTFATVNGSLAGYVFHRSFRFAGGPAIWITQLVVSSNHRNKKIAIRLMKNAMGAIPAAVGLITSHPFAVRSLERATGKRVSPEMVVVYGPAMMKASGVPYLQGLPMAGCLVDTQFFADHSEVLDLLAKMPDWSLGALEEGKEFVAVVLPFENFRAFMSMEFRLASTLSDELAAQCAKLFSTSYGVWGRGAPPDRVGKRAKMSVTWMRREIFFDDRCFVSLALLENKVIGQAFCRRFWYEPLQGDVVWIIQLVRALDGPSDVAAGLVSSHPYAIRALESATNTRVDPSFLTQHAVGIIRSSQVPYIHKREITGFRINTEFFVDHTEVNAIRDGDPDWMLGSLEDGEEIVAVDTEGELKQVEQNDEHDGVRDNGSDARTTIGEFHRPLRAGDLQQQPW
ncbi:hypothetical protein SELMODRAFT_440007 [Selaginella moellendorffii]|uniref:N-acetyltransferase domain-containing protein n=1 Tax=Selaginella moellendorffii TaxID=88036 RepID=D8R8U0_SELML|nr:hypothetical protein SELMODRAFT_440007 [Selaginella moellendorffii]